MNGQMKERIVRNCSRQGQDQPRTGDTGARVWQKLEPEHIIRLLECAAADARSEAGALLRDLSRLPWRIGATIHGGGRGDAVRGADPRPHVTLTVAGRGYHLVCREQPVLHVVQVTT